MLGMIFAGFIALKNNKQLNLSKNIQIENIKPVVARPAVKDGGGGPGSLPSPRNPPSQIKSR